MFNPSKYNLSIFSSKKLRFIICILLGISLTFISTPALANLAITSTATTTTLQTALQGNNVTISNVTVNEGTTTGQIGTFTGGLTGGAGPVIGIDDGVVMVTGTVTSAAGPNNNSSISTGGEVGPIDSSLQTVDNGTQFDTAILSFNVVPSGNFMALDFVFGSDEYNEYVCTIFNDAMGIFVSGPEITGTANIARLSTNATPISVNQINRGLAGAASSGGAAAPCNLTNTNFYVKNIDDSTTESTGSLNSPLGTATSDAYTNLQYDGFTVPLTAQVKVTPGSTYTIKIVIADIGDAFWDSGLFIDGIRSFNLDLGDAPDSYGTSPIDQTIQIPGPARHSTGQDIYLGAIAPDAENTVTPATAPNAANADDLTGTDDEDAFSSDLSIAAGVTSYSLNNIPLRNGTTNTAKLMGWIDFNKDGDFLDAGELASANVASGQVTANLSWSGFTAPTTGTSYARFRITTDTRITDSPTPLDLAQNGEVEDYRVVIAAGTDYGDAPTSLTAIDAALTNIYPSASHVIDGLTYLGDRVDAETANQPTPDANGDDTNGSPNDEDGVTFPLAGSTRVLSSGSSNTLTVKASRAGILNAWIDWNQDGDWADAGEQIATDINLAAGNNTLTVSVPNTAPHGATYARFRFSTTAGIGATGATTANGEVEDYKVNLALPAPVACSAGVLNSGFEEPVIAGTALTNLASFSGGNILVLRENDVPWWSTISNSPSVTNFDQRNGIELWNRNQTAVSGTLPFEGNQFAEINAFVAGRLYQDFAVPAGTQIRWQVAHRGRAGNDSMGVYLGAPGSEILQGSPNTTPNTEWRVYSGLYTVPSGQDVTRFALRAENTSGGAESSVGNFVDDVRLTNFCAPTVQGYKSAKLTTDADSNGKISPGDTVTYTLYYANSSDILTGPAAGFQINDPLPSGLTITAAGAQTITVSGGNTSANKNPSYTGAASGAVSDLLNSGAFLDVGGTIRVDIPVTVNADAVGTLLNQGTSSANEFSGVNVRTDNVDDTTTDLPSGVSIPGSSVAQQQEATIDPTRIVVQNPTVSNPNILLVKRITAIQGQPTNPNDTTTQLDQVVDDTSSSQQEDDNHPGWPTGYLKGAINAGPVKPGDTLEYTIYFLSSGNAPAEQVRVCDRIQSSQSFQSGTYNAGAADLQLQLGDGTGGNLFNLTAVNDGGDRAEFVSAGTNPSNCNLQGPNDNGSLVLDLTGTTGAAPLPNLPNSTGPGTPNDSYGFFRFTTKVDE